MDPEQREQMLKNEIATLKNLKKIIADAASKFKKEGNTSHEDKINAIYNVLVSTLHPDSIAYMNELNRDLYKNGNGKKQFLFDAYTDTTERLDSLLGRYKHQHNESEMTLPDLNSLSADFQKLIEYVEAKV